VQLSLHTNANTADLANLCSQTLAERNFHYTPADWLATRKLANRQQIGIPPQGRHPTSNSDERGSPES